MGKIVINRNGQPHLDLVQRGTRTIVSASQNKQILSDDSVTLRVASNSVMDIKVNDTIDVYGEIYHINQPPTVTKNSETSYEYDIVAQGLMFDMMRCLFFNADGEGFKTTTEFPLIGTIDVFLEVIKANMQRLSINWEIGTFTNNETKTITFSNDSCLSALQKICQEFKTEFWVKYENGKYVIHTGNFGSTIPVTLQHGKGKGLYSLNRKNVNNEGIINRLYVSGGTDNIPANYRGFSDRLKFSDAGYIEDATLVSEHGLKEGSIIFEDIYPKRTGVISSVGGTFKFRDSSMDFDLNEKEADGITTKYLIAGTTAKVHFNTGNLAGYEFEIASYKHATKEFEIIQFDNENGQKFPDEGTSAFQFAVGDEYVLLDIVMPQTYVTNAETELQTKGSEQFNLLKQSKVSYNLNVAKDFLQNLTTPINIGDLVRVVDSALGIDKVIRVNQITRNFIDNGVVDDYNMKIVIADAYEIAFASKVILNIQEVKNFQHVIQRQQKFDAEMARNAYRFSREFADNVVDSEGYYRPEKIRSLSIETKMISLGSRMQQFSLPNVSFFIENNGLNLRNTSGQLVHLTVDDDAVKTWNIASNTITNISSGFNYVYAKASKTGNTASIVVSSNVHGVDEDPNFYWFEVGYLSSIIDNVRKIKTTYGFAQINPAELSIGKISDPTGNNYIELLQDRININAKVTFSTGSSGYENLADKPDLSSFEATRDYVNSALQTDLSDLKNRADGVIESWFYSHSPTLSNLPASNWISNSDKDAHIGDTFTNMQEFVDNDTTPDAGKAWRFARNADNSYSWNLIANSDSTKALIEAGKAKDTADSKRRVFIAQPFPPYDLGDLWSQGTSGDLMRCKFARTSGVYVATDWEKASKYTDDTRAIQAETNAKEYTDDIKLQIDGELSDLATEITNLSDAVTDLPIGALTDTVLFGIKQQKNSVQSEYQDVYSRYLIIRDDVALTNKLPVTDAFASYYNAYNALISYFDSAFNDSAITQAEKDELTARFTAYKNQVSLFATALQNAVQAIQEQKIDNIQIGGRNLLLKSNVDISNFTNAYHLGGYVINAPLIVGETYTLVVHSGNSSSQQINAFVDGYQDIGGMTMIDGGITEITFIAQQTDAPRTRIEFYNMTRTAGVAVYWATLIKGNKGLRDHVPAPEDVAADIATANQNAANALAQAQNAQTTAAAASAVTSFMQTTIDGNVVSTGTLQVGDVNGANAGITGVTDTSDPVRFYAGATYANKETAPWRVHDSGMQRGNHQSGSKPLAFEWGVNADGTPVLDFYHVSGYKTMTLNPNRGLIAVAYFPETWEGIYMLPIGQSSSTLNVSSAQSFLISKISTEYFYEEEGTPEQVEIKSYFLNNNIATTYFDYDNGSHPDNTQYESYKGYKTTYGSRTSNIADGWYALYFDILGSKRNPPESYIDINYQLYYISGGKVANTQTITIRLN